MEIKSILSAFADEASKNLDEQIEALKANNMDKIEIRSIDQVNISNISIEDMKEIAKKLEANGIKVSSMGASIGKVDIASDLDDEIARLHDMIAKAKIFGTDKIRMFSFRGVDESPECEEEVLKRLNIFSEIAHEEGILLCHENEKGVFGDIISRCLTLATKVKHLRLVFDPANFMECGVNSMEAWEVLKPYVEYLHIKDCNADKVVVPAGEGVGCVKEILADYLSTAKNPLISVEPHLKSFIGLYDINRGGDREIVADRFSSDREAFDTAIAAAKSIYNG